MRTISLLSIGLLVSALTTTAVLARQDPTLPNGTSQPQPGVPTMPNSNTAPPKGNMNEQPKTDTPTAPNNSTVPSKGKMTERTLCPDKDMPMKLAVQPNTNYQEKGVQSSEQGKTLYQLKKEHKAMRDQMRAKADCIPRK